MTDLAARPVYGEDLAMLTLIADEHTPLGKVHMKDFQLACWIDAQAHDGMVHPSRVSAILRRFLGEFDPRSFSAKWAPACGPSGFMDKTDETAPIDPEHSRGNGNKDVKLRRWRG